MARHCSAFVNNVNSICVYTGLSYVCIQRRYKRFLDGSLCFDDLMSRSYLPYRNNWPSGRHV